jgi:hopanoid biosynthesis associated protein HpnK
MTGRVMAKLLIVNADDFGLSPGINAGIIEGFEKGVLTSASIMVNAPAFEQAVELAHAHEGLGIGVHLNVLRGKAILPPAEIPSLVDPAGRFMRSPISLCCDVLRKRIDLDQLSSEFSAQIQRAFEVGLRPTHLNSEKHVHMYPPIFARVVRLAEKHGIRAVRWTDQYPRARSLIRWNRRSYKDILVSLCARLCRKPREGSGVILNDYFYGLLETGSLTAEVFRGILPRLKDGVTEIMCHPGYIGQDLQEAFQTMGTSSLVASRELELQTLIDPSLRACIDAVKARLIHYGDIQ